MKTTFIVSLLFLSLSSYPISITGRIIDAENKHPLEEVNITLARLDSIEITQTITHRNGSFTVNVPEPGDYLLKITHVGYQSSILTITNIQEGLDIGFIELPTSNILLGEVVVSATDYTKIDRQIIFPSLQMIAHSFTGLDVISKIMLPGILVDVVNSSIASTTKRPVSLRINDVPVTMDEVLAISPSRITKIEYIDLPGIRYGDVGAVINIVLKKSEKGFSTGGNIRTALTIPYTNDMINFKYNYKLSEFGVIYNFQYSDFWDCYTDERQILQLPDTKIELMKKGIKRPNKTKNHNIALSYNWNNNENTFFNIIFRNDISQPITSSNQLIVDDMNKIRYTSFSETKDWNYKPALDIYFQHSFDEKQMLLANIVTTHIASDYKRNYREFWEDEQLKADFSYDVIGKKYSLLSEIIYENKLTDKMILSSGIIYSQAHIENVYVQDNAQMKNLMNTSELQGYVELQGALNRLNYQIGIGYSRQLFNEESAGKYTKYTLRPSMTLSYSLKENMTFRYRAYLMPYTPSLSDLSDFKQWKNEYELMVGNPNLKPCNAYANIFTFDYRIRRFSFSPTLYYQHNPNYIMSTIKRIEEDGKYYFEYSNNNQKGYRHLQFQTYAAIELVKDHLNASVVSAINRYFNFGDTYTHCYTGYYNRFQFEGYYKNWSLSVSLNLKSKMLSGETLQSYATTADFSTRYRYKSFQYGLEIMNPFLPDGNPGKQEIISEYVQKEVTQYNKNYGNMIRFTVAWNIDFGRKYNNKQKQINQADYESGIIKL